MKYIILHDISYLIKEKYKLIIGYFIIFLYYYFWGRSINIVASSDFFLHYVFGDIIDVKSLGNDIIGDVFFILNYGLPILLSISIYNKDIISCDNLYTRISISRFFNTKVLSNIIISTFLFSSIYLVALLFGTVSISFFAVIVKKIFVTVSFEILIYIIIILFKKNKLLSFICMLILAIFLSFKFDLNSFGMIFVLSIFLIFLMCINILCYYIKFSDLKE